MLTLLRDMQKEEAFWEAIKRQHKDGLPRLIFADWLEESSPNRHDRSLAFALRWSAEKERYPLVSPKGRVVAWMPQPRFRGRRDFRSIRSWMLPQMVYDQLYPPITGGAFKTNSVQGAFERLAKALGCIRDVIGWRI